MIDKEKDSTTIVEVSDFDSAIVELGKKLTEEAKTATNPDYKFKLINSVVALRGALPPMYAVNQRR